MHHQLKNLVSFVISMTFGLLLMLSYISLTGKNQFHYLKKEKNIQITVMTLDKNTVYYTD